MDSVGPRLIDLDAADGVKLHADMLPSTTWGSNIRGLVSAREWDRIRLPICAAAQNRCEVCGYQRREMGRVRRPDCHELWVFEVRDGRRVQRLDRLIALCRSCHSVQHMGRAAARGKNELTIRTLQRVNRWTREQARADIDAATARFESLDYLDYDLDLTALSGTLALSSHPGLYIPAADRKALGNSFYGAPLPNVRDGDDPETLSTHSQTASQDRSTAGPSSEHTAPEPTPTQTAGVDRPARTLSPEALGKLARVCGWLLVALGWVGFLVSGAAVAAAAEVPSVGIARGWMTLAILVAAIIATVSAATVPRKIATRIVWFIVAGLPALILLSLYAGSAAHPGRIMGPLYAGTLLSLPLGAWLCTASLWARERRRAACYWAWMLQTAHGSQTRLVFLHHAAAGPTETRALTQNYFTGAQQNEKIWGFWPAGQWVLVSSIRTVLGAAPDRWRQIHARKTARPGT